MATRPRDGWSIERLSDELDCETGLHFGADRLYLLLTAWGYTAGKRIIDRRSPAQKRFEAHFIRVYADHRVQLASQEHDAARGKVTISTWHAPHVKPFRRWNEIKARPVIRSDAGTRLDADE